MTTKKNYPIGTPGTPWGDSEKQQWLEAQVTHRSYATDVVCVIDTLRSTHRDVIQVEQYGELDYSNSPTGNTYPLFALRSIEWHSERPTILVTGGVHGYETSGVHGALRFAQEELRNYATSFNMIVAPCISPWGYETINRWNPSSVDPNRSFYSDNPSPESEAIMTYAKSLNISFLAHIDLHETTDTDNSEFRPALEARNAVEQTEWQIPDGFYGVGDTLKPVPDFQTAIIESVARVTHIAEADDQGKLIGTDIEQHGVINYATKELGLCAGFTDADYVCTTEVYPDSPRVDDENCILAQVAAVTGALDYLTKNR